MKSIHRANWQLSAKFEHTRERESENGEGRINAAKAVNCLMVDTYLLVELSTTLELLDSMYDSGSRSSAARNAESLSSSWPSRSKLEGEI